MKRLLTLSSLLAVTLFAACNSNSSPSQFCPLRHEPGVVVKLTDKQTGQPIQDASIVLSNREHSETLVQVQREPEAIYEGVNNATGTFELTVTVDGYKQKSQDGIEVRRADCKTFTQTLSLELDPEPGTQPTDVLIVFRTETDSPTGPQWIAVPVSTK